MSNAGVLLLQLWLSIFETCGAAKLLGVTEQKFFKKNQ